MELIKKVISILLVLALMTTGAIFVFYLFDKPSEDRHLETNYIFRINVNVKNLGNAPAVSIPLRLALPMDQPPGQEFIGITYSEEPERTTNDSWGNDFIHYTIPLLEPQVQKEYFIEIELKFTSIDFSLSRDSSGNYGPQLDKFLLESEYVNSNDPEIIKLAAKIGKKSDHVGDIAWNTYEWIIDNIYYQQVPGEMDASATLKNGEGGSAEYGNLFVALMRANGIPARRLSGWGHHFSQGEELQLSRFSHGWAEFYYPQWGWLPVDPTWGQSNKFDNFARTDNAHVVLTRGAGVHYLWRGPYSEPHGSTEVDTDYSIEVLEKKETNLSFKKDLIRALIYIPPVIFAIFIVVKKIRERRMN